MIRFLVTLFFLAFAVPQVAQAQDRFWVQLEAHPSLSTTESRARAYATRMNDVGGFVLGGGWYGVALGPYDEDFAVAVLRELKADGEIPRDAYIVEEARLGRQVYPIGATTQPTRTAPAAEQATDQTTAQQTDTAETTAPAPEPEEVDETPREARRSEAKLDRNQRKLLQTALKWAGFYTAAIDGAYGRGTRRSMAEWQGANGFEPTGVLTTKQRAELLRQYNAVLDGMDLTPTADATAGIDMLVPLGVVVRGKVEYPFVHYDGTGLVDGAQMLMISQAGDQTTLFGLYEIMQTLEIVPLDGTRERKKNSFVLTGENDKIISYTEASVSKGEVKGFTLVWPVGDEERRRRVLEEMRASFARIDGVIDPAESGNIPQSLDLVSGLEIRKPRMSRSGFFIDGAGTVLTTAEAAEQCGRITLDEEHEAQVHSVDANSGLAVLRPTTELAPMSVARFASSDPRLKADVAVSGYSFEGVLSGPTLTYGTVADLRGLNGEAEVQRLALTALPGDAGGPVVDSAGSVIGMLLPKSASARQLPEDVSFAMDASEIMALLSEGGVSYQNGGAGGQLDPVVLTRETTAMTVLVSCWD